MIKFRSVGWRNVSVWGLFGLLSLVAAVFVASGQTEDQELWFCVGMPRARRGLRWCEKRVQKLPWLRLGAGFVQASWTIIGCSREVMVEAWRRWRVLEFWRWRSPRNFEA